MPRASAIVRVTARVAGFTMLIVALRLLVTHSIPLAASAMARGAVPTATSPSLARVTASNAVTLSLSALTTHRRGLPLAGVSTRTLVEAVGARGVAGRYTACVKLRLCTCWLSSVTITVTVYSPGCA